MRRKSKCKNLWLRTWAFVGMSVLLLFTLREWPTSIQQTARDPTRVINDYAVSVADGLSARDFVDCTPPRPQHFYQYNHTLSDKINVWRKLPDSREPICAERRYRLPTPQHINVSVIIAFHNEARATLLRTIVSLYTRTPLAHLHEVILIDDYSEDVGLLADLQQLTFAPFNLTKHDRKSAPSTRMPSLSIEMRRNSQRLGLIESRNYGARLARGTHLFFLDSHCEVNVGWLEPLLHRLAAAMTRGRTPLAVSPMLDSIDAETLQYRASSTDFMGGFDWNLHFHWVPRATSTPTPTLTPTTPTSTDSLAFKSPTFAGGIFMISRNWFFKLDAFNSLLQIWGGESIEFSIKLWLCGGQIEIVPCSRVGHIFRQQHPFQFPRGTDAQTTYLRNAKIIAESWLDVYKYHFYASKPAARHVAVNATSLAMDNLKRNLKCRPFAWFLQNVFPELKPPKDEFSAYGTLSSGERCLRMATATGALLMSSCYDVGVTQWYLRRQSACLQSGNGVCLLVLPRNASQHAALGLQRCRRRTTGATRWQRRGAQLVHAQTHLCLEHVLVDGVTVSPCRLEAPTQRFKFSVELQQL